MFPTYVVLLGLLVGGTLWYYTELFHVAYLAAIGTIALLHIRRLGRWR